MSETNQIVDAVIALVIGNKQVIGSQRFQEFCEAVITYRDCDEGCRRFFVGGEDRFHSDASGWDWANRYLFCDEDPVSKGRK
jgi:hypothetical protein